MNSVLLNLCLTVREKQLILMALRDARAGFDNYIGWIDDRPNLPERDIAIKKVRGEVREILDLELRIYDTEKE